MPIATVVRSLPATAAAASCICARTVMLPHRADALDQPCVLRVCYGPGAVNVLYAQLYGPLPCIQALQLREGEGIGSVEM